MKRKELMVGDWVMSRRYIGQSRVYATYINPSDKRFVVAIINETEDGQTVAGHSMDELTQISIIDEILEKNGFHKINPMEVELKEAVYTLETKEPYTIVEVEDAGQDLRWLYIRVKGEGGEKFIKYVHELQRALKLFGVEKEIEL